MNLKEVRLLEKLNSLHIEYIQIEINPDYVYIYTSSREISQLWKDAIRREYDDDMPFHDSERDWATHHETGEHVRSFCIKCSFRKMWWSRKRMGIGEGQS